ncbi:MAG TPA: hypothetical protein VFU15_00150, partial [Bacteroidia bacterium]|nr:hypothetical protein [Bacteroidia bacterium]
MKKILLLFFFALAAHLLHAQRFHRRAVYVNKWYSREIVKTGAKAYCLYLNGMNEAGGGEAIEFGTDVPLFVWEKQYYFLVDADWRLAAAKHSSAGVGGSVAGEFRFYNDARRQASWGMEFSWG